jgi:predicted permease
MDLAVLLSQSMNVGQNLRYAVRTLRRSPGFACAAVISLAVGIGANAAIFSIVNGLLLHPAGIERPEEVVAPRVTYKKLNLDRIEMSATDFDDVRKSSGTFSKAAMGNIAGFNYTGGDSPVRLQGGTVTWQWFDVFGTKPILGRAFHSEEDQPGANRVAVLSFDIWNRLFGADRGIVGRTIELNQELYRVVGVMPANFRWPTQADLWVPLGLSADAYGPNSRFNENYTVVARLRRGITLPAARSFMQVLTKRAEDGNSRLASFARSAQWSMVVEPFTELTSGNLEAPMLVLLGAVGFVLLIACSNIAGLMLVRATGRARELAIRTSLGASRAELVKQAFAEALLLSVAGTAAGILSSAAILKTLLTLAPAQLGSGVVIRMDTYVLLFAIALGLVTALLFGLAPAWHMSRLGQNYGQLKEGGRSDTESHHRQRLRGVLVAAQVALALVLLVGAGLFLKSLEKLREVDTGFRPHGVASASVALPPVEYSAEDKQAAFFHSVLEKLSSSAGVQKAAVIEPLPFSGDDSSASFQIEGQIARPGDPGPHGGIRKISSDYFAAMEIPLRKGRYFTGADRKDSQLVAIVDENLARQYWPHEDPIGKRIRNGQQAPWAVIVGIVAHVKHTQLAADSAKGVYYYPIYQRLDKKSSRTAFLIARARGNTASASETIRQAIASVDPRQAVFDVKTMDQRIALALGPQQFAVSLLTAFAAAALLLAALGLYGVISYNVTQRTRELGIRAALGASRMQILGMVIRQGMRLVALGAAIGFLGAAALARLLSAQLFHVSALDPATFAWTALVLGAVALVAAYIPAYRATRVDPMTALRYE